MFLLPGGHVQVDTLDPHVSYLLLIPVAVLPGAGPPHSASPAPPSAPIAACRCSAASPPPLRSPGRRHPPRSARCSLAPSCPCGPHPDPRSFRSCGRATALFVSLTLSLSLCVMNRVLLSITR